MSKLFMKVGRIGNPRTFVWVTALANAIGIDLHRYRMTESESSEFHFLLNRDQHTALGAGGQYEYRVYETVEAPVWPFAIVWPDSKAVREQYPHACRVVDMSTGRESALTDNLEHARGVIEHARAGKLKGSFH